MRKLEEIAHAKDAKAAKGGKGGDLGLALLRSVSVNLAELRRAPGTGGGILGIKGLSPDRVEVEELRIADLGFRNSALRRSEPRRLGRSFGGFKVEV